MSRRESFECMMSKLKNRLSVSKNYPKDQFILACCMKDDKIKKLIALMMLNNINKNLWLLAIRYPSDNINKINDFNDCMKNPIMNFDVLYSSDIEFNIDYAIEYMKVLKMNQSVIADIELINHAYVSYYRCVLYSIIKNQGKGFGYKEPANKFPLDECPVCMNEKMRYVWLKCGHNICKDCYEKIQSKSDYDRLFKCPVCNQLVTHV